MRWLLLLLRLPRVLFDSVLLLVRSVARRNYTKEHPFRNPNKVVHESVQQLLHCKSAEDWPIPFDEDKFFFVPPGA